MRRALRCSLAAAMALLWLAVALLAIEAALRSPWIARIGEEGLRARERAVRARDLGVIEATAASAPRPPAAVNTARPNPDALERTPIADWGALAAQWGAILFACDAGGAILQRFEPGQPDEMRQISERVASLVNITGLAGEAMRPAFADAIRSALRPGAALAGREKQRDFEMRGVTCAVPIGKERFAYMRVYFAALPGAAAGGPPLAGVVLPSNLQSGTGRYRAHGYQTDLYPAFDVSEFWTNSLGLRDEEPVLPKPPGMFRIVCIGGSTTNEGPRNDLTYPNLLEQRLRAQFPGRVIDVVNAGIDGLGIGDTAAAMPHYNRIEPDLYVHYNFANDVGGIIAAALRETTLASPRRAAIARAVHRSRIAARYLGRIVPGVMPGIAEYRRVIERDLMPQFDAIRTQARAAGADLALCSVAYPQVAGRLPAERARIRGGVAFPMPLPAPIELEDFYRAADAFNAALRAYCEAHGLVYVPVAEQLEGGSGVFFDICHLYLGGIERKAEIAAAALAPRIAAAAEAP